MSFKKLGMVRKGLAVGGYSVAKYKNDKTGEQQLRLIRNGRAVARKTFANGMELTIWYTSLISADTDGADTIVALTEALK